MKNSRLLRGVFSCSCPLALLESVFCVLAQDSEKTDSPNYGNDPGGMRYSTLTQINRDTVAKLKVVWVVFIPGTSPTAATDINAADSRPRQSWSMERSISRLPSTASLHSIPRRECSDRPTIAVSTEASTTETDSSIVA